MNENIPERIIIKREVIYPTKDEMLQRLEFCEDEKDAYRDLLELFYAYAVQDLTKPWCEITMIDADTGEEIPYKGIINIENHSQKI